MCSRYGSDNRHLSLEYCVYVTCILSGNTCISSSLSIINLVSFHFTLNTGLIFKPSSSSSDGAAGMCRSMYLAGNIRSITCIHSNFLSTCIPNNISQIPLCFLFLYVLIIDTTIYIMMISDNTTTNSSQYQSYDSRHGADGLTTIEKVSCWVGIQQLRAKLIYCISWLTSYASHESWHECSRWSARLATHITGEQESDGR